MNQSREPNQSNVGRSGCCPYCGESAQILFERPIDHRYRVNYGYHRQVCHTHKVKSAKGDRFVSTWTSMTPVELEENYQL